MVYKIRCICYNRQRGSLLNRRDKIIMPDIFYERMDKMFEELEIKLEDTDDKSKIKEADNFISTFTPQKEPVVIE